MSSRCISLSVLMLFALGFQIAEADRGHSGGGAASRGGGFSAPSSRSNSGSFGSSTQRQGGNWNNRSGRDSNYGVDRRMQTRPMPGGMETGTYYPGGAPTWGNSERRPNSSSPGGIGAPVRNLDRSGDRFDNDRSHWKNGSQIHQNWHGNIRHFQHNHSHQWKNGHWHHGHHHHHHDRVGWWWIVGPSWFFYPAAVYPYPDPYVPGELVLESQNAEGDPAYWYYCEEPRGYYPYVAECSRTWQRVAAEPDTGPPQP